MHDAGSSVPHPPYEDLRRDSGDDPGAHASVDALRDELHSGQPDPARLQAHAVRLRRVPALEAHIALWWEDPATQRWVKALTDAGL